MKRPSALLLVLSVLLPPAGARADGEGAWLLTYGGNGPFSFYAEAAAFPDGTAYVARLGTGTGLQPEFLRSRDAGLTWTRLTPPYGQHLFSIVQMGSPSLGYAIGGWNRDLSLTRDGGETWQSVRQPDPGPDAEDSLHHVGTVEGGRTAAALGFATRWVNGCPQPPKETTVLHTHDHGRSWRRSAIPSVGGPVRVEFATDLVGAAVLVGTGTRAGCGFKVGGSDANVWVTEDGGVRWRKAFHCPDICYAVAWENASTLAVGTLMSGDMFVSKDRGRTFRKTATVALAPRAHQSECVCLTGLSFGSGGGWALTGHGVWHASFAADSSWDPEPAELVPATFATFAMDIAVADPDHAVAAATNGIVRRVGAGTVPRGSPAARSYGPYGPPSLVATRTADGWSMVLRAGDREAVIRS